MKKIFILLLTIFIYLFINTKAVNSQIDPGCTASYPKCYETTVHDMVTGCVKNDDGTCCTVWNGGFCGNPEDPWTYNCNMSSCTRVITNVKECDSNCALKNLSNVTVSCCGTGSVPDPSGGGSNPSPTPRASPSPTPTPRASPTPTPRVSPTPSPACVCTPFTPLRCSTNCGNDTCTAAKPVCFTRDCTPNGCLDESDCREQNYNGNGYYCYADIQAVTRKIDISLSNNCSAILSCSNPSLCTILTPTSAPSLSVNNFFLTDVSNPSNPSNFAKPVFEAATRKYIWKDIIAGPSGRDLRLRVNPPTNNPALNNVTYCARDENGNWSLNTTTVYDWFPNKYSSYDLSWAVGFYTTLTPLPTPSPTPTSIPTPTPLSNSSWFKVSGGSVHANKSITNVPPPGKFIIEPGANPKSGIISFTQNNGGPNTSTIPDTAYLVQDVVHLLRTYTWYDYYSRRFYNKISLNFYNKPDDSGTYIADNNLLIDQNWNIDSGKSYVIFVPGDLRINNNIKVANGGFIAFIVNGNIIVNSNVGNSGNPLIDPYVPSIDDIYANPHISGIYIAGGGSNLSSFDSGSGTNQLLFSGTIVAHKINLQRSLTNNSNPAEIFAYRPDLWKNAPYNLKMLDELWHWTEVEP